jgi:hypothetical protein
MVKFEDRPEVRALVESSLEPSLRALKEASIKTGAVTPLEFLVFCSRIERLRRNR